MTYGNYPDLTQAKRALVIKMRHHGDVLLTSALFSELKRAIPEIQIDAFIYGDTLPMLEGHPCISSFHLYERAWKKKGLFYRLRQEVALLKAIRAKRYDLVINLTEGDRGAIAASFSKSPCRVGIDSKGKKSKVYTHRVKQCPHPRHTVEKQLDALRCIGIFPSCKDLYLHIPESATLRMQALIAEASIERGQYILIHPASRWRFKCLSVQQMADLISQLHEKGKKIVLSAGPDAHEIAMIAAILERVSHVPVLNCAGKLHLKELGALIQMSEALICVDSVPLHIASALKTPVVVAFGPTSDQNWRPWMHPNAAVVAQQMSCRPCYQDGCGGSKMSDCLFSLPVQQILSALERVCPTQNRQNLTLRTVS